MVIIVKTEGDIIVNDRDIRKCKGSLDAMKIIEKNFFYNFVVSADLIFRNNTNC